VDAAVGDDEGIVKDARVRHNLLVSNNKLEDHVANFCTEGEET
jgi:hypothetical protein